MNAPKDRTLFNYSPKHGWPMLSEFLGLPSTDEAFPHENKTKNTVEHAKQLFTSTESDEYDAKVQEEIIDYMKRNGYECKKITQ